ncbi:AMP-binding protein [Tardiphaga sp. 42S5]|uniref:AMP-binding protein n=1 Tax=Tardiphaga sp. 42S5 TaxID=1404799 RepID=UPI002A5AC05C|nr:AMP-binding protein [Tardiphaga sp. 42S5]WPO43974.1 AMP-binding protein [Tardiphaga sp. 42S5]
MIATAAVAERHVRPVEFAPREVDVERREDGCLVLTSPISFVEPEWNVTDWLPHWAEKAPDRVFLAQRVGSDWETISYDEMWRRTRAVGQALLERGGGLGDKVAILSGNSIEHAIVKFAAMTVGMVAVPVSPNYTLMPGGIARLSDIARLILPSFVFVQNFKTFGAARDVPELGSALWITAGEGYDDRVVSIADLYRTAVGSEFEDRRRSMDRDAPAKILFTSGSTGLPKGVINTHRMMSCALEMGSLLAPTVEPPVQVEWLPWHHTMGGNVILQGILKNGGTLYIDDGRPVPQLFNKTVANLASVSPTAMFNVPGGYTLLCEALEENEQLRQTFFKRLERITYAGAAIAQSTLDKLYELSVRSTGRRIPVMSGYGTTETAPTICTTHWATELPGELGLPGPGLKVKLVPAGESFEVRVRGPNVTPGYFGQPDLTRNAFDEEGYYRVGDTVAFLDPQKPSSGLRFTGRLSENFKLANGTWVIAGELRAAIVGVSKGLFQDVVIAGENREHCAVLAWLNPVQAKQYAASPNVEDLTRDPGVIDFLRTKIGAYNGLVGSSVRIGAVKLLVDPPSLGAGEITDKAYVNQRAVLTNRHTDVNDLYASEAGLRVFFP